MRTNSRALRASLGAALLLPAFGTPNNLRAADPVAILALSKAAAGGDAWDRVRTIHACGRSAQGGLTGPFDEWDDALTGRYVVRWERPPSSGADGFDGVSVWTDAGNGQSYVYGDEDARLGASNRSYQESVAYWFPARHAATLADAGSRQEDGRTFDVLDITPAGGRPFSLWVDRATHLIDRFVEEQAEQTAVTRFSDYRIVDGIQFPFAVRHGDGGDAKYDEVDTVESVVFNGPPAADQFALPAIPPPDSDFPDGETSRSVPFQLSNDRILIPVRINGHGPFPAELDSGGNYLIQPSLAEKLGLVPQGTLKATGGGEGFNASSETVVDTVEIGGVRLRNQRYKILALNGQEPDKTLLGLQIFQRFVVRIDFDNGLVTLTRPEAFAYRGDGATVPFHFQDNQPEVHGSVDGIAGVFAIDTGDNGSLLLIAPFARRYGLYERYHAQIPYGGHAVGGSTNGLLARVGALTLCGADGRGVVQTANAPLTRLSQQTRGFDANRYVSGNVGVGILKQFNLTFDYRRQVIIFEKNHLYGKQDIYNRTGLHLEAEGPIWRVSGVDPDSPAAELGLTAGDRVLAVDGRDAAQAGPEVLNAWFRQEVGTKIILLLSTGGTPRQVELTLRNIL